MAEQEILGIDFGLKNIGLAVASLKAGIPDPLKTVSTKTIWKELETIMKNYNITRIVIGLPLRTDGREDGIIIEVRNFADEVKSRFKVPVILWDERFTTQNAEKILIKNQSKQKGHIDHFSAALILEEYFESLNE